MDILQFDNLSLFKSIILDEESLIIKSKDDKYAFYINFKDEIKGVDNYDLSIVTKDSVGFINQSGPASKIHKAIIDTLNGETVIDDIKIAKVKSVPSQNKSSNSQFFNKKQKRK